MAHRHSNLLSHSHTNCRSCPQQSLPQNHCRALLELISVSGGHRELCPWLYPAGWAGKTGTEHLDRVGRTGRVDSEVQELNPGNPSILPRVKEFHSTRNHHAHPKPQLCRFSAGLSCGPLLGDTFQALCWGWKEHFVSLFEFVGQNQWDFQVCGCQSILSKC